MAAAPLSRAAAPRRLDAEPLPAGGPILVLAPHPDDFDAIGVTLRRLQEGGRVVHVAVATTGAGGVDDADCEPPTPEAKAALREAEQHASCAFFGLPEQRLRFLRLPPDAEGKLALDAANAACVAEVLREVAPVLVFLPHGRDANVTHQRVYRLLTTALRVLARVEDGPAAPAGPTLFLNRDPKTTAMRYDVVTPYGEVEAAWKGELLRHHRTQQARNLRARGRGFDERILEMDRDTARLCGLGEPYAEGFEVERPGGPAAAR